MRLSNDQIETFNGQGYLSLPGVFSPAEVAVLAREVPGIFAQERQEVWRERNGKAVRTAFAAHTYNEAFRRLAAHPRMVEPVRQILGGDVYVHQFKINGKEAFDGDV
ncbi:MAG: phytanoyl-CoA dioxygenase family protein, partial [Kiloniellaceae bacterium]